MTEHHLALNGLNHCPSVKQIGQIIALSQPSNLFGSLFERLTPRPQSVLQAVYLRR
jgi:hypothetical protein